MLITDKQAIALLTNDDCEKHVNTFLNSLNIDLVV